MESKRDNGVVFKGPAFPQLKELNIAQLVELQQHQYSEREAIVSRWQEKRLTYQELQKSSYDIARRLYSQGVRAGHHVLVVAGNKVEYIQLLIAVGGLGAIFCIANPTFTSDEVLSAVDFLEPKAIFVAERIGYRNNKTLLSQLVEKKPPLIVQIGNELAAPGIMGWKTFLQQAVTDIPKDFSTRCWAHASPDDTLCIQFTSGTTGPRKAAMGSHRNIINNAVLTAPRLGLSAQDAICCCTPVSHCFALVAGVLAAISVGGKSILPSDVFVAEDTLEALSEEPCTALLAVPAMFLALLDHPDASHHVKRMRLKTGISAGQTLPTQLAARLDAEFGLSRIGLAYGITEASCLVFLTDPSKVCAAEDNTTVGSAMPHTSVKAVDSQLQVLPLGSQGELLISGYTVFQGYYKNVEKTSETLVKDADGNTWLRTGDLVMFDSEGRCTITGRVKDMIKKGGENIFPADIEKTLEQHPDIESAAVVGIPDPSWGENVGAFLKRKTDAGNAVGKKELRLWLRKRLAPHKVPEQFFWIGEGAGVPDVFPVNHTGKLMKAELREAAERLVAAANA